MAGADVITYERGRCPVKGCTKKYSRKHTHTSAEVAGKSETVEHSAEDIADAIIRVDEGMQKLNESALHRDTVVLLVSHSSGCSQRDVRRVIESLETLKSKYLKKT